jgi:hypothetical protein
MSDPLITGLLRLHGEARAMQSTAERLADFGGAQRIAAATTARADRDAAIARLSAVLAAAREIIAARERGACAPEVFVWIGALADALASADREAAK